MATETVTTVSVRELKAKASEIIRKVEGSDGAEVIITRHGKPCAKLVALGEERRRMPVLERLERKRTTMPWSERVSLLNSWANLQFDREPTDEDFLELKKIWEPKPFD